MPHITVTPYSNKKISETIALGPDPVSLTSRSRVSREAVGGGEASMPV